MSAVFHCLDGFVDRAEGGHDDDGDVGVGAACGTQDVEAGAVWHAQVGEYETMARVGDFVESGAGVEREHGHVILSVEGVQHLNALVDKLRAGGGMLSELSPVRSTLEDVFVDLVRASDVQVGGMEDGRS